MPAKNLLEHFVLKHVQVSRINAELTQLSPTGATHEAKVELNLTPRLLQADSGEELPSYQVSARLSCQGGGGEGKKPTFTAQVAFEAVYQQVQGEPIDVSEFTANHASLTRQIYPLLQNEMRGLLSRLGLEQINLPYDLSARVKGDERPAVQVSGALH